MTSVRDRMRAAFEEATQAQDRAIAVMRELGREQERDELIAIRDDWARTAYRMCKPRGRHVVPPIVPASHSLKPMRKVPALRVVERSPRELVDEMRREAERQAKASRELLHRAQQESLDAG